MTGQAFYSKERLGKIILYMVADALLVNISLAVASGLWFEGALPGSPNIAAPEGAWEIFLYLAVISPVVCIAVSWCFRLYSNLWKYASIDEVLKIFIVTVISFIVIFVVDRYFIGDYEIYTRRLFFTAWLLYFMLFTFSRFGYRAVRRAVIYLGHIASSKAGCKRIMVIGAGYAGYGVVRGMLNSKIRDRIPVIILDDDISKNNTYILGVRVLGGGNIAGIAEKFQIDEIIIAITNASEEELQKVIMSCIQTECKLSIVPPMNEVSAKTNPSALRDLNVTDLLLRDEVLLDEKNIAEYILGRTVLVTGAGGTIGSELCRQIAKFNPEILIIFDIYENNAYMLCNELVSKYRQLTVSVRIGSIRDMQRLGEVFSEFKPDVIFHAAAHKHVPLMEESPSEAVNNNVFGAYNVIRAADKFAAEKMVIISTDKAVNPTSIMGATKRIAELIMQDMALRSKTKYMAVRFGNVLGSSGSIVPLFQQQIEMGGPVTVTHPAAERYFMTIQESARLVLQAAGMGMTGRVFILNMGSPLKIADLAGNLIKLSGLRPGKDIEIVYTGLRPGEKLFEELIMDEEKEGLQITCHEKIFMTKPVEYDYTALKNDLEELRNAIYNGSEAIEKCLMRMVPAFKKQ
jgi:FlaA1/EpsC-like NDP-sugar epimerase